MAVVSALFVAACLLLAVFGTGAFLVVDHLSVSRRRLLFLGVVLFSLLPLFLHAHYTARWVANFGPPADPAPGFYPALRYFLLTVNASVVAALLVATALSRIAPLLCALVPLGFGWLYRSTLLPLAYRDPPGGSVLLDNMPLFWAAIQAALGAVLVLFASIRLRYPLFPWDLRWISWHRMRGGEGSGGVRNSLP